MERRRLQDKADNTEPIAVRCNQTAAAAALEPQRLARMKISPTIPDLPTNRYGSSTYLRQYPNWTGAEIICLLRFRAGADAALGFLLEGAGAHVSALVVLMVLLCMAVD